MQNLYHKFYTMEYINKIYLCAKEFNTKFLIKYYKLLSAICLIMLYRATYLIKFRLQYEILHISYRTTLR